ncbi:5-hydroxytryptamine receptor 1-like [Bolinopsis microptera]|uniref:5-hydroxytryptamine receptor 1-like n=1 Tax=Bolinopsis microptera TaxID=2820187 RepID=UPI00307A28C9
MNPTMHGYHKYYFLLFQIGSFPVPLVVAGYSYTKIFTKLLAMKNKVKITQNQRNKGKRRMKPNQKAAITVFVACGAFMFCTLPSTLIGNAFWFGKEYEIDRKLLMATAWVLYFNSALNPIIYGVFNPEFRSAYKRIITRRSSMDASSRTATVMGQLSPLRRLERHHSNAGTIRQHVENTIRFRESLKSTRVRSQSCVSMCTADNKYRSVSLITQARSSNLASVSESPLRGDFTLTAPRSSVSSGPSGSSAPNDSVFTSTVFSNILGMSSVDSSTSRRGSLKNMPA